MIQIIIAVLFVSTTIFAVDTIEYKVVAGDTLSKISKEYLSNPRAWKELLKYNKIDSPNKIKPGLLLKIPDYLAKNKINKKPNAIAKITTKLGKVKYKKETDADWMDAKKDQLLESGMILNTQERGVAEIVFFDDPEIIIQMREKSILKIKLDKVRGIELVSGESFIKFLGHPKKETQELKFNVTTPTSVAGVRGTEFNVSTDENGLDKYGCSQGLIQVSAQGETVEVPAGFGTIVKKGEAPQKPFKLLDKIIIKPIKVKRLNE